MKSEKGIYKVATLQDFGYPAVSLFAEMHSGQLYLFLSADDKRNYGVIPVSQDDLMHYIDGENDLPSLTINGFHEGYIKNGMAIVTDEPAPSCRSTMAFYGDFDEELYYDEMQVLSFLYDLNHNNDLSVISQKDGRCVAEPEAPYCTQTGPKIP